MNATEDRSVVGVLKDGQTIRGLDRSLEEARQGKTVSLDDAYSYWAHHIQTGSGRASIFSRSAITVGFGALIGSLLTSILASKNKRPRSRLEESVPTPERTQRVTLTEDVHPQPETSLKQSSSVVQERTAGL